LEQFSLLKNNVWSRAAHGLKPLQLFFALFQKNQNVTNT